MSSRKITMSGQPVLPEGRRRSRRSRGTLAGRRRHASWSGRDARITVTAPLQPYTQQGFGGFQHVVHRPATRCDVPDVGQCRHDRHADAQSVARLQRGQCAGVLGHPCRRRLTLCTAVGNIGGYRGPTTAWFRYHLMGDQSARSLFYGASCGLCTNSQLDRAAQEHQLDGSASLERTTR